MVDSVESGRPERGRHDYWFLLQDEAILNGEFLTEVPVVVECFGAFLSGRWPPFMYHFSEFAQVPRSTLCLSWSGPSVVLIA